MQTIRDRAKGWGRTFRLASSRPPPSLRAIESATSRFRDLAWHRAAARPAA